LDDNSCLEQNIIIQVILKNVCILIPLKELIPQNKVTHQENPKDTYENRQKEKRYNLHRQQHYPYFEYRSPQLFEQSQISFSFSLYF